jgi:P-type Ca2+ transporter type 2C
MTVTTCYVNRQEYTEQELARSKEREVGKRLLSNAGGVLSRLFLPHLFPHLPFLMKLLHTVRLRPAEWLALLLLSATPLLVHELLAFLFRKRH